jgi:hypothetical protein
MTPPPAKRVARVAALTAVAALIDVVAGVEWMAS